MDISVLLNDVQSTESKNVRIEKVENKPPKIAIVEKVKDKCKKSPEKIQSNLYCDKKSTNKEATAQAQNTIDSNVPTSNGAQNVRKSSDSISTSTNTGTICSVIEQNRLATNQTFKSISNNIASGTSVVPSNGKKVYNYGLPKDLDENITNEKDLSDELFGNFPLPQTPNESNPNALSPTAAFLLSFPVVSTVSNSKPTETDNSYSEGTSLLRLEDKQNQPKDHNLFESISSILNDLNDVSDGKNIPNVDSTSNAQFAYCTNRNRSNIEHDKTNTVNDSMNRNKVSQKNLHVNNLLNDNRMQQYHASRDDTSKISTEETKKQQTLECSTSSIQPNGLISERANFMPTKSFENVSTPVENTSDFYVSLSTLGLPLKSGATLPATSINPSSHFNFQISSLAQPRNLIETRPIIADTPFTFSLTKCSDSSSTTTSSIKLTSQQPNEHCQTVQHRSNKPQKKSSPTKHLVNDRFVMPSEPKIAPRCNSFNPFSFDNPPILSSSSSMGLGNLAVSSASSSIGTPFTFTLTPTFPTISSSTPLLSNHDPLFSSSFDMPIIRSNNLLTKTTKKDKTSTPFAMDKDPMQITIGKSAKNFSKPSKNLVNWMTSSVNKPSQELHLDFISSPHCTASDEPSAWSPNRLVDNTSLISSSALPMLQGDLALNTITSSCNVPAVKFDIESKKIPIRANDNQKSSSNLPNIRKPEQSMQPDRNAKVGKSDKIAQTFKNHHQSASIRMNESNAIANNAITNNFHSVSQLLDQERQTANKNSCYIPNDAKMHTKDSTNSLAAKQKLYSKYEPDAGNQLTDHKFQSANACAVGSNDECDRDLFGGYFFSQSKRLKLNYHSSGEFLGNQGFSSTYENPPANEILPSYANYQTFDSECNNVSASSCINNLSNQTYSYPQYTQPQAYNHQPQQQLQSVCDPIDSSNYFQASGSLSSYKPPNFNEITRSNAKIGVQQPFLHQTKSNDPISNGKLFAGPVSTSASNISTQLPMCSINRNTTACPTKTIHYPSHSNINNLPLNQAWNDSFSWMPYTNSIDKPYNNNLFNNTDTSSKSVTTNNISANNNTIPNFNLTTIFPDYNKS